MKKTKKDLYDYLDGFYFVGEFEILMAIEDFFKGKGNGGASYGELVEYGNIANEYMTERGLEFEE